MLLEGSKCSGQRVTCADHPPAESYGAPAPYPTTLATHPALEGGVARASRHRDSPIPHGARQVDRHAFYANFSSDAASVHRANRALNRHGRVNMSLMMTTYRCGATAAAKDDGEDGYRCSNLKCYGASEKLRTESYAAPITPPQKVTASPPPTLHP